MIGDARKLEVSRETHLSLSFTLSFLSSFCASSLALALFLARTQVVHTGCMIVRRLLYLTDKAVVYAQVGYMRTFRILYQGSTQLGRAVPFLAACPTFVFMSLTGELLGVTSFQLSTPAYSNNADTDTDTDTDTLSLPSSLLFLLLCMCVSVRN